MTWWQGLILGIVQGLTEFLPISSSGHLVVAQAAIGFESPGVTVEVVLHIGTLLAVMIVYKKTLVSLLAGVVRGERTAWTYVGLLALASVPAAIAGILLKDIFESAFDSLVLVGINFLVTGGLLWSTRRLVDTTRKVPSARNAFTIGAAQAFAILPGISRSGTTVAAGLWLGLDPVRAAEFSFLMAIPAIAGAGLLQLSDVSGGVASVISGPMLASFVAAMVFGVWAIRVLIALLRRKAFYRFAPYCWALGVVTIVWGLVSG